MIIGEAVGFTFVIMGVLFGCRVGCSGARIMPVMMMGYTRGLRSWRGFVDTGLQRSGTSRFLYSARTNVVVCKHVGQANYTKKKRMWVF